MNLFWNVFMLGISLVFCNNKESKTIQNTIQKTFGYDCEVRPMIGEILFWKMSSLRSVSRHPQLSDVIKSLKELPLQEYIRGTTRFEPNETYLVLTKIVRFQVLIFYWVGLQASLDDKKQAAKYSIQHYSWLKRYYHLKLTGINLILNRERATIESEIFLHLFNVPMGYVNIHHYNYNKVSGLLLMYPNLYIVRGFRDTTRMKKVPLGTLWLRSNTCVILETGYNVDGYLKVYSYCGTTATVEMYARASHFASHLSWKYRTYLRVYIQIINNTLLKCDHHLKSFIELLEDRSYLRPHEVDNSNDHLKDVRTFIQERDAKISLCKITSGPISNFENLPNVKLEDGLLKQFIIERPISSALIRSWHANYILNTASISGVFVRFGSSELEGAVKTMQHAEEYVHNIELNISWPISLNVDGASFPKYLYSTRDMDINFIDFPPQLVD